MIFLKKRAILPLERIIAKRNVIVNLQFALFKRKRGVIRHPLMRVKIRDLTAAAAREKQDHKSNDNDPGAVIVEQVAKAVRIHSDHRRKSGETPFIKMLRQGVFLPYVIILCTPSPLCETQFSYFCKR